MRTEVGGCGPLEPWEKRDRSHHVLARLFEFLRWTRLLTTGRVGFVYKAAIGGTMFENISYDCWELGWAAGTWGAGNWLLGVGLLR